MSSTSDSSPDKGAPVTDGPGLATASIPRMGAEAGFEVVSDEELAPIRWTGILCLVLGALSFAATVAYPMVFVPMVAIVLGLVALRRYDGPKPVGTRPAIVGLMLACGFGSCGLAIHQLKRQTLGRQAEQFARNYIELSETGDFALALELQKSAVNRQMKEANLDDVYATDEAVQERVEEFSTGLIAQMQATAGQAKWELAEPVHVYQKYGYEKANTLWVDTTGTVPDTLQIEMQWNQIPGQDTADWQVSLFQWHRERIVAPSIL